MMRFYEGPMKKALFPIEEWFNFSYNHICMGIMSNESPDIAVQVIRSRRRTLSVEIGKEGEILVRAPKWATKREISLFLQKNSAWIANHKEKALKRLERSKDLPKLSETELNHLVKIARKKIPERVAYYAPLVGVNYGRISIRKQHTRWGSCSKDGNLNFNVLLLLAPPEVLDSVVVHELCHRVHMNHSKEFYDLLYRVYPGYDQQNKWLKTNGDLLMSRLPERK